MSWHQHVVFAAALFLSPAIVLGQTVVPVAPGASGTLTLPFLADPTGVGDYDAVSVTVDAPPQITINPDSILGPVPVTLGQSTNFVVSYAVDPNATGGNYTVKLHLNFPGEIVSPDPATLDTSVNFTVGNHSPSVTMTDLLPTGPGAVPDYLYENFTGAADVSPSTLLPANQSPNLGTNMTAGLFAWVNSPAKLASVVMTGPVEVDGVITPDATSYFLRMPAPLPVGAYTLTAIDSKGNKTVTPVTVASMNAAVVSEQLVASPFNSCVLSGQITLDLSASMNLDHLTLMSMLQPPIFSPPTFSAVPLFGGQQRITLTIPPMQAFPFILGSSAFVTLFDSDGNTLALRFNPLFNPISNPDGTFQNHCDPTLSMFKSPMIRTEFDTQGVAATEYAPLGLGASVSDLQVPGVSDAVILDVFLENAPAFSSGYQSADNGLMYGLMVEGAPTHPFTLTLPVSAKVDQDLLDDLAVVTADAAGNLSTVQPASLDGLQASFPVTVPAGASPFVLNSILEVPTYPNAAILTAGGATLLYNGAQNSGVTLTPADPAQQPLAGLLSQALLSGLALNGPVLLLGPEGTVLGSPAYLTLPAFTRGGSIFELSPGLPPQPLSNQSGAYQDNSVSGSFAKINSYFAVFKSTPVPAPSDLLPPRTTLDVGSPKFSSGTVYVAASTTFSLTAVDDKKAIGDGAGAGIKQTLVAIDTPTFSVYAGTFSLSGDGVHVLRYYSVDLAGNSETISSAAVALDATAPISALTTAGSTATIAGTLAISSTTTLGLAAADPVSGGVASGLAMTRYRLAQGPAFSSGAFQSFTSPFNLAEGDWRVDFQSQDNVSNLEPMKSSPVFVDATPPVSSLVIGTPQATLADGSILIAARTPLLVTATDPVSNGVAVGVKDSLVSFDGAPFSTVSGSFTISGADGSRTVSYFGRDKVMNAEAAHTASVLLDSTPPQVSMLCPSPNSAGLCRVFKGRFAVLGSVFDPHMAGYQLDFGSGSNPTAFTLISSGTVSVNSGVLGSWDTTELSGSQTLRLSAVDVVGNASALTVGVFIGDPVLEATLGERKVFNKPQGVAVGADGRVYIADRNNDRVAVFTSTGGSIASFGGLAPGEAKKTGGLSLNKPGSVAVDAAGDIYVADTNDARVLKLSPTGQILLELNGFTAPSGVAVDAAGKIYATDAAGNFASRYTPSGSLELTLPGLSAPSAVAVDGNGNIYIANAGTNQIVEFAPDGTRLLAFGAGLSDPQGIAVSPSGDCILVSDTGNNRILKFDRLGDQTLAFGSGSAFNHPYQLALDASGALWIADRNDDRAVLYDAPGGFAPAATLAASSKAGAAATAAFALAMVTRASGGSVARLDSTRVDVPAGALATDAAVSIARVVDADPDAARKQSALEASGLTAASDQVEFGPNGSVFAFPVTISLPYDGRVLAQSGLKEADLRVHYWNPQNGDWEPLDSSVDTTRHLVSARTSHFSVYRLAGRVHGAQAAGIRPAAADPSFGLRAAYAFPNPAHAGAVTIRLQAGLADSVSVRIYDMNGRNVHQSSDFVASTLDDGNGLGAQITNDHLWDVSGVGSGVYTYVVTARKAGRPDIHKTGKIGIVK